MLDEGAIRLVYIPRLVMPPSQVKNLKMLPRKVYFNKYLITTKI